MFLYTYTEGKIFEITTKILKFLYTDENINIVGLYRLRFISKVRQGTTYDVHLGLIGERVVDFLLVLIELFSLGDTAEALRAKIDRKSAISLQRGQFDLKFQV